MCSITAAKRSIDFVMEHPVFYQAIAVSIVGTSVHTAWNNGKNIETAALLRVYEALICRITSQDEHALNLLRSEFVSRYVDIMVLLYTIEMLQMKLTDPKSDLNEQDRVTLKNFLESEEYAKARSAYGMLQKEDLDQMNIHLKACGLLDICPNEFCN